MTFIEIPNKGMLHAPFSRSARFDAASYCEQRTLCNARLSATEVRDVSQRQGEVAEEQGKRLAEVDRS